MSLLLSNAVLPDGQRANILIDETAILAIGSGLSATGETIDVAGALVAPAFIDGHVHLDKTHMGAPLQPHQGEADVHSRIATERRLRHEVGLPIEDRARALLRQMLAFGTTRVRSHVDIDTDVKLDNLHALLRVREEFADLIDIQLVAFPQSGIVSAPGTADLMDQGLAEGVDLVGGLDPHGFDGDIKGHLDVVFGLAEKHNKGVDIHLHDGGETGANELRDIAARTIALGLEGQVTIGHAFSLGMLSDSVLGQTAEALARAGASIMTSSPPPVPVPPIRKLQSYGVNVFGASDNIRDCWSPFGNGDMLDRASIICQRQQFFSNEDIAETFALITSAPAKALGVSNYGLKVGDSSDLVVIDARATHEAIIFRAQRNLVIRRGRVVAQNGRLT